MSYLTGRPALAQILGHQTILQVTETSTLLEVVLGQEHVPKSQLPSLRLQILDNGRV